MNPATKQKRLLVYEYDKQLLNHLSKQK